VEAPLTQRLRMDDRLSGDFLRWYERQTESHGSDSSAISLQMPIFGEYESAPECAPR